jgi:cyclohexadienyl dehydratase
MGGISVTLDRAKKGFFSQPYMHEGKTPIARCADAAKYQTLAEIDQPQVKVIANPGGTNERFDRAHFHAAEIIVYPDNLTIFDQLAKGAADVMITDASETRYQQKLHPGALCAIHPDKPFDFAEKAYWMAPDPALQQFVDQWLHLARETGAYDAIYAKWFE